MTPAVSHHEAPWRAARAVLARPEAEAGIAERLDALYQVVLFNDDVNPMEHVVLALQRVFGHPVEMAVKIMLEAHAHGRAIAQVEDRETAQRHKQQLQALHLTAAIEPV